MFPFKINNDLSDLDPLAVNTKNIQQGNSINDYQYRMQQENQVNFSNAPQNISLNSQNQFFMHQSYQEQSLQSQQSGYLKQQQQQQQSYMAREQQFNGFAGQQLYRDASSNHQHQMLQRLNSQAPLNGNSYDGKNHQPLQPYQSPVESTQDLIPSYISNQYLTTTSPQLQNNQTNVSKARPITNILTHIDGTMLLQEVLLHSKPLNDGTAPSISMEGIQTILDIQGIWGKKDGKMLLSIRAQNDAQSRLDVADLIISFGSNSFGLFVEPFYDKMMPESGVIKSGSTFVAPLSLSVNESHQQFKNDFLELSINVEYTIIDPQNTQKQKRLHFEKKSYIPLHIFFFDHPQRGFVNDGRNNGLEDFTMLSVTDDGPRMTQNAFLSQWKSIQETQFLHSFNVKSIPVQKWVDYYVQFRDQISIVEHKLSVNRIYQVASRTIQEQGNTSYVFYSSFKVGLGSGQLILCEIKLDSHNYAANVTLKGCINTKLWPGIERALTGILLS